MTPVAPAELAQRIAETEAALNIVAVHLTNGIWGVLALGLFANGSYGEGMNGVNGPVRGLFFGDSGQFIAECIGIAVNLVYVGGLSAAVFFVLGQSVGNRVPEEDEFGGLDVPEMGIEGYSREMLGLPELPDDRDSIPPTLPARLAR
jgi:Amt family ammonium transporter